MTTPYHVGSADETPAIGLRRARLDGAIDAKRKKQSISLICDDRIISFVTTDDSDRREAAIAS